MQTHSAIIEIREGDSVRLLLPIRNLSCYPTARRTWGEAVSGLVIGAIVAAFFATDKSFGLWIALPIFLIAVIGATVILLEHSYLRAGRSRSEVQLGDFAIITAEKTLLRWRDFRFNALEICRLRALELPDRFVPDDSENPTQPAIWGRLAVDEIGSYALVAEDNNGRRMFRIAVAYPRDVILALANRIKVELDLMRAAHHDELLKQHPGVAIPDSSRRVPICVGDRFSIAIANAKKPAVTNIQLRRIGEKTEIVTPRGHQLETIRFLAHAKSLLIERQLLLGKIQIRVAAADLLAIQAQGTEYENSDSAELIIDYHDQDQSRMQRVVLLQDFTFEEVAWVAAELRDACLPLGKPGERRKRASLRFSMAQVMFLTALVGAICAPLSVSWTWGWLYAIQLVVILLCVTSFSGAKSLGRITRRSWTQSEIVIGFGALGVLWLLRFIALLNGA